MVRSVDARCADTIREIADLWCRMDAHEGQAAWAQFAGALIALSVALGLGVAQFLQAQADRRERIGSYMAAAFGAAVHAELAIIEAEVGLGALQGATRSRIHMDRSRHNLASAEAALASLPLHAAPNVTVVKHLLASTRAVRGVLGHLEAFLSSTATRMDASFEEQLGEGIKARKGIAGCYVSLLGIEPFGAASPADLRLD